MPATSSPSSPVLAPAEAAAALVSEPLTWAEICALYPDEWVCLVDIQGPPNRVAADRSANNIEVLDAPKP